MIGFDICFDRWTFITSRNQNRITTMLSTRITRVLSAVWTSNQIVRKARWKISTDTHPNFFELTFFITIDDRCSIETVDQFLKSNLFTDIFLNELELSFKINDYLLIELLFYLIR